MPSSDQIIAYASRTGTRRNLDALRAAGWRLMVSAKGVVRTEGFRYALDNGAWWAHINGQSFDDCAFIKAYEKLGHGADFVVLPDIVAGGMWSLEFSLRWRERLNDNCQYLLAVQDGMEPNAIASYFGPELGIFVGGTTRWKLANLVDWGRIARETNAYIHVGRVNSMRRIVMCQSAGVDSFDGSNASRFSVNLSRLERACQRIPQKDLFA